MRKQDQWQVVSLELAKKMKELGYKQDSLWYWCYGDNRWDVFELDERNMPMFGEELEYYSAPTVAELGRALTGMKCGLLPKPGFSPNKVSWSIPAALKLEPTLPYQEVFYTEVYARAKMWIYLKENNLLTEGEEYGIK